jgi:hypothetical protein
MSKRKTLLILLTIICLVIVVLSTIYNYSPTQATQEDEPQSNTLPSEGPEFVVPESPMGTIGLISALAAASAIFALKKKK